MALSSRSSRSVSSAGLAGRARRRRRVQRVVVVVAATAVVAGSASAALATPASPPDVEVAVSASLAPVLHGTSTDAGTGAHTMGFYARTVGSSTWNLLNDVTVAGTDAYQALPSGRLAIGQAFQYQIADCDSTGCATSAVSTGYVSPLLGAGARAGATRVPFTIGDKINAQVDVGTGNLLVSTTQFALKRRDGDTLAVGAVYNSATLAAGGGFGGSFSPGWRLSTGTDIRLEEAGNGDVVFYGPNGLTGTFTPNSSGGYTAPPGLKMTLTAGDGWTLTDHSSGDVLRFASGWLLTGLADRAGNATSFTYTSDGYATDKLTTITGDVGTAGASTLSVASTGDGPPRITGITQTPDAGSGLSARSVAYGYDPTTGNLTSITDTLGRTTALAYDGNGRLASITAPGGAVTSFGYDATGRVATVTQPTAGSASGAVSRFEYDPGRTLLADPNSNQSQSVSAAAHTSYALTGDGNLLVASATDPAGNQRSATYTPFLDLASATDPAGTTTLGHTANGGESLTGVTAPTGAKNSFGYTNTAAAQYEPTSATDTQTNTSTFTYDGAGNPLSGTDATSAQASLTRNPDGTVATSTTPSGGVTSYGYDPTGQLTSITPPAGTTLTKLTYTYDGFGRLATATDGRGITTSYSYDAGDRLTKVSYSDGTPAVTYGYNRAGQVATRVDASGTTTYTYDPPGRLATRTNTAGGGTLRYTYDPAGNLATDTNADGTTSYTYDARELVTSMTGLDGKLINFANDSSGRRTDTWFATNAGNTAFAAHTHTDYDATGRITRIWTSQNSSDTTRVSDLSYTYASPGTGSCATAPAAGTDTGLRWSATDHLTGAVTSYCYDHANRLTAQTTAGGDSWTYTRDANGNITSWTHNGTLADTHHYNPADELTDSDYAFDAAGNTTTADWGGQVTLTYTGAGQNTGRDATSYTSTVTNTYAGTDQTELISQTSTDHPTRTYAYGRTNDQGLPIVESYTQSGSTYAYLYDPQGTPLALRSATGTTHYLALDGLGSTVATINDAGTLTGTYTYTPTGEETVYQENGSTATQYQIYTYAGGIQDIATNYLIHYGKRWYDAYNGRFTQQDDINTLANPTRANRYQYADGNPTNYVDPTGRSFKCVLVAGGLGLAAGVTGAGLGSLISGETAAGLIGSGSAGAFGVGSGEACAGESTGEVVASAAVGAVVGLAVAAAIFI